MATVSKAFRIALLGDVMLGRLVDQIFPTHVNAHEDHFHATMLIGSRTKLKLPIEDYKYPWGNVLNDILKADTRIINLETSITTHPVKWPNKEFNYRMHPDNVKILQTANVEYCSLANNHTLDFSYEGMFETMRVLTQYGIHWAGIGNNLEEAQKPAIFSSQGRKIACFSFADHYDFWAAGPTKPGINYLDVDEYTQNDIERIKKLVNTTISTEKPDLIVVSLHWGGNYCWIPSKQKQMFAHQLIDECGVDIIHGHSSHHVQGIEIYKGKPIVYGCGDFVDDYAVTDEYRNDLGCAYFVDWNFDTNSVQKMELLPTKIENFSVTKSLSNSERKWLTDKMTALCKYFGTSVYSTDDGKLLVAAKPVAIPLEKEMKRGQTK